MQGSPPSKISKHFQAKLNSTSSSEKQLLKQQINTSKFKEQKIFKSHTLEKVLRDKRTSFQGTAKRKAKNKTTSKTLKKHSQTTSEYFSQQQHTPQSNA